ncbi:SURF1 family protein [Tepidimonas charontis]|uniref:SURF1-like protein n=1 Tax=Tepidimonas charontis TaxID=2267262 RepID=A0A554X9H6_9BURK|nr:SURF1 family protein [Tepidimonas charontis]TSE32473.1 SURF1 family protein [Tepidimonas charontis]
MTTRFGVQRWAVTLSALLAIGATARLGLWQLDRAAEKRALQQQLADRAAAPVLGWDELEEAAARGTLDALVGRAVRLQGRWQDEATVFLDNRPMNGRAGFIVVTPLLPPGQGAALLVQRGWVPRRADDRTALPTLRRSVEPVRIEGRLAPPPSQLFEWGPPASGPIRQNIDPAAISAEWRLPLLPLSVQQTAPPEATEEGLALQRDWTPVAVDPAKHIGYAVQWFALSAVFLGLYVWYQFLQPRRRRGARV